MRVLVEQTRDSVVSFLQRLDLLNPPGSESNLHPVGVHVLMGGDVDEEWYLHPEQDAVIIGTQDMLLSRALNRGYALSRFRWPVPYGLLNNDALWVLDEVQLMGAGVPTTAQMAAFRDKLGTHGPGSTLWMSATLQNTWLDTVDHPAPDKNNCLGLGPEEKEDPNLKVRLKANKILRRLDLSQPVGSAGYPADLASKVTSLHQPGTQTLVMVNTINRAQKIYSALLKEKNKGSVNSPEILLVHSRYRPYDRQEKIKQLLNPLQNGPGRIVVCTQVLEAGVNISSALLVTECATWSSMVQRFGRCNRYGEYEETYIYWVDVPDAQCPPYDPQAIATSRTLLNNLESKSAAPGELPEHDLPIEEHEVIRLKDLMDLFDTAPDLSGNDVDVSRFIRDEKDTDVWACWRTWTEKQGPPQTFTTPLRDELCTLPIGQLKEFLKKKGQPAWGWDYLDRRWRQLRSEEIWPGQVVILRSSYGGYDKEVGWDPALVKEVPIIELPHVGFQEASGDDPQTFLPNTWQTIAEHSSMVVQEMETLLASLQAGQLSSYKETLLSAARHHDLGKSHPVFQQSLLNNADATEKDRLSAELWAKSRGIGMPRPHSRPHFRHELASLLALLQIQTSNYMGPVINDLMLYLVASHHGKLRLAIRSLPGQDGLRSSEYAPHRILGIESGDALPAVDLGGGVAIPPVALDLSPVEIGGGVNGRSWLARSLALRDSPELGPFRLSFLEALLRAADARASAKAEKGGQE